MWKYWSHAEIIARSSKTWSNTTQRDNRVILACEFRMRGNFNCINSRTFQVQNYATFRLHTICICCYRDTGTKCIVRLTFTSFTLIVINFACLHRSVVFVFWLPIFVDIIYLANEPNNIGAKLLFGCAIWHCILVNDQRFAKFNLLLLSLNIVACWNWWGDIFYGLHYWSTFVIYGLLFGILLYLIDIAASIMYVGSYYCN